MKLTQSAEIMEGRWVHIEAGESWAVLGLLVSGIQDYTGVTGASILLRFLQEIE